MRNQIIAALAAGATLGLMALAAASLSPANGVAWMLIAGELAR